jgi:ABC-2 type transport system permease protein
LFKLGDAIPHYPIYLLLGVMIFSFWGEATSVAMGSIAYKGDLIRKVYFPRMVLVISSTLTSLITFFLNMIVLAVFAYFTGVKIGFNIIPFTLLMLELYIFIMGVSFYLAALFVKYRDIGHIWQVGNQVLFYATPIVYPMTLVPDRYAKIMVLSPLTQIIQDARSALIGIPVSSTSQYWGGNWPSYLLVIVIFITGYLLFQKMAAKFAEEV